EPQRFFGIFAAVLGVGMEDHLDRQVAGHFADGMSAHAVGDHEHVAAPFPGLAGARVTDAERVLVVAAFDPHVGAGDVAPLVFPHGGGNSPELVTTRRKAWPLALSYGGPELAANGRANPGTSPGPAAPPGGVTYGLARSANPRSSQRCRWNALT